MSVFKKKKIKKNIQLRLDGLNGKYMWSYVSKSKLCKRFKKL